MLVTTRIGYLFLKQQTQPGMYPGGVRGGWQGGAPTTYKFKFKLKKKNTFCRHDINCLVYLPCGCH